MYTSGFKSYSIRLAAHGWLFKDIHVVNLETLAMITNDTLKLNNPVNTSLINPKIILYHDFLLNIYEYL